MELNEELAYQFVKKSIELFLEDGLEEDGLRTFSGIEVCEETFTKCIRQLAAKDGLKLKQRVVALCDRHIERQMRKLAVAVPDLTLYDVDNIHVLNEELNFLSSLSTNCYEKSARTIFNLLHCVEKCMISSQLAIEYKKETIEDNTIKQTDDIVEEEWMKNNAEDRRRQLQKENRKTKPRSKPKKKNSFKQKASERILSNTKQMKVTMPEIEESTPSTSTKTVENTQHSEISKLELGETYTTSYHPECLILSICDTSEENNEFFSDDTKTLFKPWNTAVRIENQDYFTNFNFSNEVMYKFLFNTETRLNDEEARMWMRIRMKARVHRARHLHMVHNAIHYQCRKYWMQLEMMKHVVMTAHLYTNPPMVLEIIRRQIRSCLLQTMANTNFLDSPRADNFEVWQPVAIEEFE